VGGTRAVAGPLQLRTMAASCARMAPLADTAPPVDDPSPAGSPDGEEGVARVAVVVARAAVRRRRRAAFGLAQAAEAEEEQRDHAHQEQDVGLVLARDDMDTYSHVLPGLDAQAAGTVARLILGDAEQAPARPR
jgi:hypothetical protein